MYSSTSSGNGSSDNSSTDSDTESNSSSRESDTESNSSSTDSDTERDSSGTDSTTESDSSSADSNTKNESGSSGSDAKSDSGSKTNDSGSKNDFESKDSKSDDVSEIKTEPESKEKDSLANTKGDEESKAKSEEQSSQVYYYYYYYDDDNDNNRGEQINNKDDTEIKNAISPTVEDSKPAAADGEKQDAGNDPKDSINTHGTISIVNEPPAYTLTNNVNNKKSTKLTISVSDDNKGTPSNLLQQEDGEKSDFSNFENPTNDFFNVFGNADGFNDPFI